MVRMAEELLIPLDPIRALPRAIATRHKREKRICFREVVDSVMRSLTLILLLRRPSGTGTLAALQVSSAL